MDAQAGVVLDAQLYDMESDPGEISNLAQDARHAGTVAELKGLLQKYRRQRVQSR